MQIWSPRCRQALKSVLARLRPTHRTWEQLNQKLNISHVSVINLPSRSPVGHHTRPFGALRPTLSSSCQREFLQKRNFLLKAWLWRLNDPRLCISTLPLTIRSYASKDIPSTKRWLSSVWVDLTSTFTLLGPRVCVALHCFLFGMALLSQKRNLCYFEYKIT